jgi:hypothetical protein
MIPKAFTASNDEILTTKAELTKMLPDWEKIKIPIIVSSHSIYQNHLFGQFLDCAEV